MDPVIKKLNQIAQRKLSQGSQLTKPGGESPFRKTLDKSMMDRLLDKMQENYGNKAQNEMTVISAENIHVETRTVEVEKSFGSTEKYFDMFKEMNKDLLSLDSAIETLTTPGFKMNPRQLLAIQAGIANTTIMAEGFSRFTDAVARGIQTIVQTQVG